MKLKANNPLFHAVEQSFVATGIKNTRAETIKSMYEYALANTKNFKALFTYGEISFKPAAAGYLKNIGIKFKEDETAPFVNPFLKLNKMHVATRRLRLTSAQDPNYESAAQGTIDARFDVDEGWIDSSLYKSKKDLANHLRSMIGASDQYIDAYYAECCKLLKTPAHAALKRAQQLTNKLRRTRAMNTRIEAKRTLDLTKNSTLIKWAEKFVYSGEYSKSDWEEDGPQFNKFNRLIYDLPEDKRLACIFVLHGKEEFQAALSDSKFKDDFLVKASMLKLNAHSRLSASEELTPKQKQLDVNNDGEISGDDLKKIREGKKPEKTEAAAFSADKLEDAGADKSVVRVLQKLSTVVKFKSIVYDDSEDVIQGVVKKLVKLDGGGQTLLDSDQLIELGRTVSIIKAQGFSVEVNYGGLNFPDHIVIMIYQSK